MSVRLNDLDFHIEVEGAGPPLLLLHGFTGSVRGWDGIRPQLAAASTIVAIDLIGHGRSASPDDPERYSLDWCTRDLLTLLDALGCASVDVLGYSMGGRVALHFAVHAPARVRRLILESATPGIEDAAERQRRAESDDALAQRILDRGVSPFVSEWERQPLLALAAHVADDVRDAQRTQRLNNSALGLVNSLRGMGTGRQASLWPRLAELDTPVQLIVGRQDERYCAIAQRMRPLLRHGQLAVVSNAGHTVHLDQPAEFVRHVNKLTRADTRCYIAVERLF